MDYTGPEKLPLIFWDDQDFREFGNPVDCFGEFPVGFLTLLHGSTQCWTSVQVIN